MESPRVLTRSVQMMPNIFTRPAPESTLSMAAALNQVSSTCSGQPGSQTEHDPLVVPPVSSLTGLSLQNLRVRFQADLAPGHMAEVVANMQQSVSRLADALRNREEQTERNVERQEYEILSLKAQVGELKQKQHRQTILLRCLSDFMQRIRDGIAPRGSTDNPEMEMARAIGVCCLERMKVLAADELAMLYSSSQVMLSLVPSAQGALGHGFDASKIQPSRKVAGWPAGA